MVGEASGEDEITSGIGFSGGSGRWMQNMVARAGGKWAETSTLNVIGCHPPDNVWPGSPKWRWTIPEVARAGVEYCKTHHMWPGVAAARRQKLVAVGAQALTALTGRYGIHTWRGSPLPLRGANGQLGDHPQVMPIIHPAALMRQAKLVSTTVADLRKPLALPPENYNLFPSLADVQRFRSTKFAFDFEWDRNGITICGLSDRFYGALVVPWVEPYLSELRRIFEGAEELIGHNIINADLPWLEKEGWTLRPDVRIEDTLLKQHLCQPDLPHGLDFVASVFTRKVFWKGKGWEEMDEEHEGEEQPGQQWKTWDRADALPRELGGYGGCRSNQEAFNLYNARDTDGEFQIDAPLTQMLQKWDLTRVYRNVSRPAAYICRWVTETGLRIDTTRLGEIRAEIDIRVEELESRLPPGLAPYERTVGANLPAPPGTYRPATKVCKGSRKEPHEPTSLVFTNPGILVNCPACNQERSAPKLQIAKIIKGTRQERVVPYNSPPQVAAYVHSCNLKEVIDRKSGNRTTGAKARGIWAKDHPEFTLLGQLKEQITLRNNFAKDALLGLDRMFFNLKVHGTSEGRLSSTARRRGIDLQIQNCPEEFRVVFVPEYPTWGFLNGDLSQGENWLTAWIAQDWERWEKLQDPNYDEHSELASRIFGKSITKAHTKGYYWAKLHPNWTPAQCSTEARVWDALRQIGKKINHGRNYGMGVRKQLEELLAQGYDQFTERDVREFVQIWKQLNARTAKWQDETIQITERQGFLQNSFGRIRWFSSHSIATESLAFLPASTLADCVLRMMIAHYPSHFQKELEEEQVQVYRPIVDGWRLSIQVHDSLVFQGEWSRTDEQQERSHSILTQPWAALGGFAFRADWKRSMKSWGECK